MPQASRKDPTTQRAQDKESKRARGALSCAECRRLKLKCDKTVPCSSCKRRGCSAICPNGSLITGQGTRFVLADTEKLHQKIAQMSDRIRQLEDALAIVHSTQSKESHPLLHRDLLKIKSSLELHSAVEGGEEQLLTQEEEEAEESQYIDAFGTLAIRDDGAATFYGRSAGSESLLIGEAASPSIDRALSRSSSGHHWALDSSLASLSTSFPLTSTALSPAISLDLLVSYLPEWSEARRLCQLYLDSAPWFFGAVTERQIQEEIMPLWYQEAVNTPGVAVSTPDKGGAHELALLFVIFCFGALTDMELPPAPDNPESNKYFELTKVSLNLEPVLDRPPSVATVQTLSLMAIYEGLCSGENSIESTWALMGLATKLAQSIGLHRDCARWKLPPGEVQKRRALFWELFITDCWQSLATGRLATFSLPFVDCELPSDPDQTMVDDGTIQPSFPFWKARFGAECVAAVVQGTLTSRAPKYSIILELDRKVRDMELPLYAQGPPPQGAGLAQTMSHFMPTNYRELTLLYIHRCFFAHAISSNPLDPIKSNYAPSFLAGYRSACAIINSVKQQFTLFPAQIARFWVLWTHAFSASVMLASVITHSPQSKVAPAAFLELKTGCDLFENAATYGGRAVKFLPILKRLQAKAQQVFRDVNSGIPPVIPNDIFKPSQKEEEKDELSIFSGKTHTVNTKGTGSTRTTRNSPQASTAVGTSSRASSGSPQQSSPQQSFSDNPSFAGVHPSLVNELNGFDVQIRKQIRSAYQANNDIFGGAMSIDPPHRGHLASQQEQNRQAFQKQLEHQQLQERQRLEKLELERQELERQEVARQQHLHSQQQHQHSEQQHRQQLQQQMQVEHEMHHQQQQVYPQYQQPQTPYAQSSSPAGGRIHEPMADVSPVHHQQHPHPYSRPRTSLHHSQSRSNLHQTFQQGYPISPSQPVQPPSAHVTSPTQQQSMNYDYPPHSSPVSASSSSGSLARYTPPTTSYGNAAQAGPSSYNAASPVAGYQAETYQYWPAASTAFSIPEQQQPQPQAPPPYAGPSSNGHSHHPQQGQLPHHQQHPHQQQIFTPQSHYTPEGALRGIAADDRSLQETWQSYMFKVGSPRHLLED